MGPHIYRSRNPRIITVKDIAALITQVRIIAAEYNRRGSPSPQRLRWKCLTDLYAIWGFVSCQSRICV